MWWHTFVIPVHEKLRQEDGHEFKVSLGYIVQGQPLLLGETLSQQTSTQTKQYRQRTFFRDISMSKQSVKVAVLTSLGELSEGPRSRGARESCQCTEVQS